MAPKVAPPLKLKNDGLAPPKLDLGCEAPPKVGLGWDAPPKVNALCDPGLLAVLVFDELLSNLKTSFPVEAPPPNENPPVLAVSGADDPVLVELVSFFHAQTHAKAPKNKSIQTSRGTKVRLWPIY